MLLHASHTFVLHTAEHSLPYPTPNHKVQLGHGGFLKLDYYIRVALSNNSLDIVTGSHKSIGGSPPPTTVYLREEEQKIKFSNDGKLYPGGRGHTKRTAKSPQKSSNDLTGATCNMQPQVGRVY